MCYFNTFTIHFFFFYDYQFSSSLYKNLEKKNDEPPTVRLNQASNCLYRDFFVARIDTHDRKDPFFL